MALCEWTSPVEYALNPARSLTTTPASPPPAVRSGGLSRPAEAYAKKFDQVVIEGDDEEDALEEETEAAVDAAGISGGATA